MKLTCWDENERTIAKTTFSDNAASKTLDIVIMVENGKNKSSIKANVNITMLT